MQNVICVYIRNGEYRVVSIEEALATGRQLAAEGWKNTATLNPEEWLGFYLNADESTRFEAIESISA